MEGLLLLVGLYVVITFIARAQKEQARRQAEAERGAAPEERRERLADWRRRLVEQLEEQGGVVRPSAGDVPAVEMARRLMGVAVRPADAASPISQGRRVVVETVSPSPPVAAPRVAPRLKPPAPRAGAPAAALAPQAGAASPAAQRIARLAGRGLRGAVALSEIFGAPRGAP